jgi:hypothetical protein
LKNGHTLHSAAHRPGPQGQDGVAITPFFRTLLNVTPLMAIEKHRGQLAGIRLVVTPDWFCFHNAFMKGYQLVPFGALGHDLCHPETMHVTD